MSFPTPPEMTYMPSTNSAFPTPGLTISSFHEIMQPLHSFMFVVPVVQLLQTTEIRQRRRPCFCGIQLLNSNFIFLHFAAEQFAGKQETVVDPDRSAQVGDRRLLKRADRDLRGIIFFLKWLFLRFRLFHCRR